MSSPHWFFCCNTHLLQVNMTGSQLYPPSFLPSTYCSTLIISPPSAVYHNNLIRIPQQPLQFLTTNLNSVKFGLLNIPFKYPWLSGKGGGDWIGSAILPICIALHLNILVLQLIPRTSINFSNLQTAQAKQCFYPMTCWMSFSFMKKKARQYSCLICVHPFHMW